MLSLIPLPTYSRNTDNNSENGEPGASLLEEIVVTSRKRSENLHTVPIAISAFSKEDLELLDINTLYDIGQYVPNLNITQFGQANPAHAGFFIRGIGTQDHVITVDHGVGLYVDGVYIGRQIGANLDVTNIERIEVLRGPQGTLYGRNSIGGAINIITQKPDKNTLNMHATVGSRNRKNIDVYTSFRFLDNLAASLSTGLKTRDGFGDFVNLNEPGAKIGEQDHAYARLVVNWHTRESVSLVWSLDIAEAEQGAMPLSIEIINPDGAFGLSASQVSSNPDNSFSGDAGLETTSERGLGTSLNATWQVDERLRVNSIISFRDSQYSGGTDGDGALIELSSFPEQGDAKQNSFEIQANYDWGSYRSSAGLYYFNEDGRNFSPFTFFTPGGFFDIHQETKSAAIFSHLEKQLTSKLSIGAGLRYTDETKDADAFISCCVTPRIFRSESWDEWTWDIASRYELSPLLNSYISIAKGFQSGGFPARPFGGADTFVSYDPTTSINVEVGLKGQLSRQWQLNAAIFYTEYTDLALQFSEPAPQGFITITSNAGKSESQGIELESVWQPEQRIQLKIVVGYNDAQIKKVDPGTIGVVAGDKPQLTPRWTVSVAPQYRLFLSSGASLLFHADYSYRSKMFGQSINNSFNELSEVELVNIRIAYENKQAGWTAAFYGANIFDERYDLARVDDFAFTGVTTVIVNSNRSEFGFEFIKRFSNY
jgi:iron complex outermembrane recepter protein